MGSKSTKTTQTNEPPSWAKPMLTRAAKDAQALYEQGKGYNTYTGPTQAPLSDPTLSGMNSLLAATGYSGAPVSNQSINSLIPDLSALFEQVKNRNAAPAPQAQAPQQPQGRWIRNSDYNIDKGGDPLIWMPAESFTDNPNVFRGNWDPKSGGGLW